MTALAWSVVLLRRLRDWRIGTVAFLLACFTLDLLLRPALPGEPGAWYLDAANLLLSLAGLGATVIIGRLIVEYRQVAEDLRVEKAYF
ncbi:MAG TPA: hypothetical protein VG940_11130, partial [Gemmatimonadales bacterium]|nr:hypothetical protein [Gemmatimonadales bacterium]